MAEINWDIQTFDDAVEYIADMIGSDFYKAYALANAILENPSEYTGIQANVTAIKLSVIRYKVGLASQLWKKRSTHTKRMQDSLIKDALMATYAGLEEVINTLKLSARQDIDLTK